MGKIKSALELALERTRDVPSDPDAVLRHESKNAGKRLFAALRDAPDLDAKARIEVHDPRARGWVREGLFDAAHANVSLPQSEADLARLEAVERAFVALAKDGRQVRQLIGQVRQFFAQYLKERTQVTEALRRQFEPRVREREQQLAQKLGRPVRVDPASDPEFSKYFQSQMAQLEHHYRSNLAQFDQHLSALLRR